MKKIIGNNIAVYIKNKKDNFCISGLLIDITEESIYLQGKEVFIIPRENVEYCTTQQLPEYNSIFVHPKILEKREEQLLPSHQEIKIFIDNELFTKIYVDQSFKLSYWHDGILKLIMDNPDINFALSGKDQKSIEYSPGEVYIKTEPDECIKNEKQLEQNAFSIGMNNIITKFSTPSQMVEYINKISKRKNTNE